MYTILDIETTGGKFREEKIIEIALYKYDGETIIDSFSTLVNPEKEIHFYVKKLTGITEKMVKRSPKFHEIAKRIVEICKDSIIIAHNAEFDYRMLKQEFKSLGYSFESETLDTIELSKILIPNEASYSLGKLCKSLGIILLDEHRAFGDAGVRGDFGQCGHRPRGRECAQDRQGAVDGGHAAFGGILVSECGQAWATRHVGVTG